MIHIIDPHLHLFALAQGQYHWLRPANPPHWSDKHHIARSYSTADLSLTQSEQRFPHTDATDDPLSLSGFVHIEAGFDNISPWRELAYLERDLQSSMPFNSIAGCDLTLPTHAFSMALSRCLEHTSCVGVRHILDDDAPALLTNPQVLHNLTLLAQKDVLFEAQFSAVDGKTVGLILAFLHAVPRARWVINHAGFVPSDTYDFSLWRHNMQELAACPNVVIKASGWEMNNRTFALQDVFAHIDLLRDIWGESRLMLASNFPLITWRMTYAQYWQAMIAQYRDTPALYFDNAKRIYGC